MKKSCKLLLILLCGLKQNLFPDLSHGVLEKYKNNNIFICMGIYSCINLARSLNAGFTELHGIDGDEVLINHAKIIFPHDLNDNPYRITNYHFHLGGIPELEKIMLQIKEPITFFLANNFPEMDQAIDNNILKELDCINKHPIKTHTIFIDYIHYADTIYFGNITLAAIKQKLLEINPNYLFAFEKGGHLEQENRAILVAYLE